MPDIPAEIRTEYLMNTSLQRYRYARALSSIYVYSFNYPRLNSVQQSWQCYFYIQLNSV
jgi:hypothetical protein